MSARETSIEVYHQILEDGTVGRLQKETVQILREGEGRYADGWMTGQEVLVLGRSNFGMKGERDTYQQRLSELVKRGVAEEGPVRPCSINGRRVHTWRLTGNAAEPIQQKKGNERAKLFFGVVNNSLFADQTGHRLFVYEWRATDYAKANGGMVVKLKAVGA